MHFNRINSPNIRGKKKFAIFLGLIVIVIYGSYGIWFRLQVPNINQPHIIIIVADDVGWNDVSFHGADQIPTPNIDALAYNGVILNRHYVLPTGMPSRSSLMTGRYAIRDGMQGQSFSPGVPNGLHFNITLMPEYMRQLGYETRLVGKWDLGYYTENHTPTRRGFDYFFGYYNSYVTYFNKTIGKNIKNEHIVGYDLHRDHRGYLNVAPGNNKYFTNLITDEAVKIIQDNDNRRPLFLEIAHLAAHSNGNPDDPLEVRDIMEVEKTFAHIRNVKRRKFAGVMKSLDTSVGRVIKALNSAKMLENSIILFMSDNGAPGYIDVTRNYGSNYPLRGVKNTLFEGGVRGVACIFSPLIKKSSKLSEQLVHVTDWLPTLYSAAGGNVVDLGDIDGLDQWKSLVYGSISPRTNVLINIDEVNTMGAAIVGRYKLIKGADNSTEGYYGDPGNELLYVTYRIKDSLNSVTGRAIRKLPSFNYVSDDKARNLRKSATVNCQHLSTPKSCSETCLFDIISDPCETRDLSNDYSIVSISMLKLTTLFTEKYLPMLIRQDTDLLTDPCSFPKYFNGTWMPWKKHDDTFIETVSDDRIC